MGKHKSKRKVKASDESTVSDAIVRSPARSVKTVKPAPEPEPTLMSCEFCDYRYDASAGRYGCPNCNGEGLEPVRVGTCIALMAVNPCESRPVVRSFPIIPTFGSAGAENDMSVVLEDSVYQGFRMMTFDGDVWLEPYEV